MAYRAAGTATSSPANNTLSLTPGSPAGLAANDIIIILASFDGTGSSGVTFTFPTGFTQFYTQGLTAPDGQLVAAAWKVAAGGDTLTVTRTNQVVASWVVQAFCWSGRDTVNPPVQSTIATNTTANASPTTVTANGVTALLNDDLVWIGFLDVTLSGAATFTQPTGYTSRATTADTLDGFDIFALATKDAVSAGATGTVAGSLTHSGNSGWVASLIRIPVASALTVGEMDAARQYGQINPVIEKTEVVAY